MALHVKLIEEFKEQVPDSVTFEVGYYEGQKHAKVWIFSDEDLQSMYEKYPKGGDVTLWCEGRNEERAGVKRKREREDLCTRRQEREEQVEDAFQQLKEKHKNKYDIPQLRLWAHMVVTKQHENLEEPPDVPAFSGSSIPKKTRRNYFQEAISGAAVTLADALKPKPDFLPQDDPRLLSPGKAVNLRMKNLEQLRYLQQLHDDNILTSDEYQEQKQAILAILRNL